MKNEERKVVPAELNMVPDDELQKAVASELDIPDPDCEKAQATLKKDEESK